MRKIKVIAGQTLFDIAVQVYGDVRSVIILAMSNNISVTQTLAPGMELVLPTSEFTDLDISRTFAGVGKKIATATTQESSNQTGLDYLLPNILPMSL